MLDFLCPLGFKLRLTHLQAITASYPLLLGLHLRKIFFIFSYGYEYVFVCLCTRTCTCPQSCVAAHRDQESLWDPLGLQVILRCMKAERWSYGRAVSALLHCAPLQPSSPFLVSSASFLEDDWWENIANKTRKERCGCMEAQCILSHPPAPAIWEK